MPAADVDARLRLAAFAWLARISRDGRELVPWSTLVSGFAFEGRSVPLISQRGIWRPRILGGAPLSITTSPKNPYQDTFTPRGELSYHYFGSDADHPDNVSLRDALRSGVPLIYLHGVLKGSYLAVFPVFIVGDDRTEARFRVIADDMSAGSSAATIYALDWEREDPERTIRRRYAMREVRQRLHQRTFRERVLAAYHCRCALCRLRHPELLDAAHIVPDADERGIASVTNGLALCKIHHASFDANIIGISPDYRVSVRQDVLDEVDGPMLDFGLKGLHDQRVWVPRNAALRPDPVLLDERFAVFRKAG